MLAPGCENAPGAVPRGRPSQPAAARGSLAHLPGCTEAQLALPHQALKFLCEDLHSLVIHIGQLLPDASAALLVLTVGFEAFELGLQGRNHVIGLIADGRAHPAALSAGLTAGHRFSPSCSWVLLGPTVFRARRVPPFTAPPAR